MKNYLLRIYYTCSDAISNGVEAGASVYNSTKDIVVGAVVATGTFVASSVASYAFQGNSIMEQESSRNIQDISMSTPMLPIPSNTRKSSTASICSQLGYSTIYSSKGFINRYFLFTTILEIFGIILSTPLFWGILASDVIVKLLFDFTNEGFESNKLIAQFFNKNDQSKPFYEPVLSPLSSKPARKTLRAIGSAEHAFIEDLSPWIGYMPEEAIAYLASNVAVRNIVISLAATIGLPLAVLVFVQTYLFEGVYTERNLASIRNQLETTENKYLPHSITKILSKTINLMGPLHGIAGAMPVFYVAAKLIPNPLKWPVTIVAALLVGLGICLGVHHSEVKEAKAELEARVMDDIEKAPIKTESTNSSYGTNETNTQYQYQ